MSLLEFEHVSKRHGSVSHGHTVLHDVSFEVHGGELVTVWGRQGSGRSTLLRIAAGVEGADSGVVRFQGKDITARRGEVLGEKIGYCWRSDRGSEEGTVLDQLMVSQMARGVRPSKAKAHAWRALERAGAQGCSPLRAHKLDGAQAVRVMIARALTLQPSLLVIDEPTRGVDLLDRDEILLLLRSLADEGVGVLSSTGETTGLSGADRALSLSDGEVHGDLAPELASVLPLRRPA
jgi:ABC-type multidrug transport system ATPase subunit